MPQTYKAAQELLIEHRADPKTASEQFQWPELDRFNWALDWFDAELASGASRDRPALRILGDNAKELTFGEMAARSNQIANGLRQRGVGRGDRILLMLGNVVELWETMLAAMKLGAVLIPSTLLLTAEDLAERVARARIRTLIVPASEAVKFRGLDVSLRRFCTGEPPPGWTPFDALRHGSEAFVPDAPTLADDPMLLYFTSGTTSKPKMVLHSHRSYPVGHLATMYWVGLQPGDTHLSIGSPGWAGHTFMAFFSPWNAGATIVMLNQPRFDAKALLDTLVEQKIVSFFAPPTVWRLLLQEDLRVWPVTLREAVAAGEPLNAEVIERVRRAWNLTVRDGWGQSEMTVQIANSPNQDIYVGALGRPLPGCALTLIDENENEVDEGEIAFPMEPRPPGLMLGYLQDDGSLLPVTGRYYRCGDVARRNPDGTFTYIGRADDIFKSSDYRISPFELESVLIEHPAVVEAGVVPSPDRLRLSVPKAFIAIVAGYAPNRETALSIFHLVRARLAPYKRVRRLQFVDLPKTVSGKIRRVELRQTEASRNEDIALVDEFREEEFPELR
jgi:acetyl-CoA synthetase